MTLAFAPTLFDSGDDVAFRPLRPGLGRTELADGAWVDHYPGWVVGADTLFGRLVDDVGWRAEERPMYDRVVAVPRLIAFFDAGTALPDPALDEARRALSAHYAGEPGGPLVTTGLCLYRDGDDSVAPHGDRIGRGRTEDTVIAIVSLGERRRFLLRPVGGGAARRFEVGRGDLLVMGGSCQRTWEHAVPKTRRPIGPRISVQFRQTDVR